MDELVQWLTACFAEDERLAHAACWDEQSAVWTARPPQASYERYTVVDYLDDGVVVVTPENADADGVGRHIAEHGPARVLREVEAKRKLLALLPELEQADRSIEGEWGSSDDLAGQLLDALLTPYPKCGATTVFWPDDEGCDAVCVWPRGHGGTRHQDEALGGWDEGELTTSHPSE